MTMIDWIVFASWGIGPGFMTLMVILGVGMEEL